MKPESGCSGPQRLLDEERRCGDEEARSGQQKPGGYDPARRQYVVSQGGPSPKCADPITLVSGLARAREREALDALWDLPKSGRLRDVRLLDQLIRETKHPSRSHPATLNELAGGWIPKKSHAAIVSFQSED